MFAGLIQSPLLPWSLFALTGLVALLGDRLARLRRPTGERGDYWTRLVHWYLYPLALLLLLSAALAALPAGWWPTGWHLYLDRTGFAGRPAEFCYLLALLLPFGGAAVALLLLAAFPPGTAEEGRQWAGGAGFHNRRHWLLTGAFPLIPILLVTAPDLGGGEQAYPAAVWAGLALLLLCLVGTALSAGRAPTGDAGAATADRTPPPALKPWPTLLAEHGIRLQTIKSWPAAAPARAVRGAVAQDLAERLQRRGARGIAPELVEAAAVLLEPMRRDAEAGPFRLVFAPDHCGQIEVVGLTAALLDRRIHALTLVVRARGAAELARQWRRWLPELRERIVALDPAGEIPPDALIWVADAEFLSDRLLPALKNPLLVRRIGLVVWWDLQDYSGVQAANLWAVTRRLYRLLQAQGYGDVRTLALLRRTAHGGAQQGQFVRRLLPQPLPPAAEIHIDGRNDRPLSLYRLDPAQAPDRLAALPLAAGWASVAGHWPTWVEPPDVVTDSEWEQFQQAPLGMAVAGERLIFDPPAAAAWLLPLQPADVLALPERIGQAGRAAADGLPAHVGVLPPANPYADHLLATLDRRGDTGGVRRLVGAEAHPRIVRRHLLLALNELSDTGRGLLQNALWDEQVVQETLRDLAFAGQLTRREVRFLDSRGRLVSDWEYRSRQIPATARRPLDTVGVDLIAVRESAGGMDDGGIRRLVDPERLLIKAYPRCVFMQGGQRYRVREWHSIADVKARGWLECQREGRCSRTWRIRNAFVYDLRRLPEETAVAIGTRGRLNRIAVDLTYEEEITGVLEWVPSWVQNGPAGPYADYFEALVQRFDSRALLLRLLDPPLEPAALPSLAQALREVLPVHLGVEEDALEVVVLSGQDLDGEASFGLAVVDLYPGGIGLIDAIRDDSTLLLQLLEWTRDWLAVCADQDLQTPAAQAVNPEPAQRPAALRLLEYVL